jgi:hypothetical protein
MNTSERSFVLIHSPLVGSSFWQPVARELESRGSRSIVPLALNGRSLLPWRHWPERIGEMLSGTHDQILVGHSAAGMLLPAIAANTGARGVIFVDANVPPASGAVPPVDPEFMKFVRTLPIVDGKLPLWSEWWPKAAMAKLLPNEAERSRFDADLPQLTLDWFDDIVDVPAWDALHIGYVQTSERFSGEAENARARGWPVVALQGSHLHPLLAPVETAAAILAVCR